MHLLDVNKPIFQEEELVKAVTKEIYYKRTENIKDLLQKNRDKANLIGFLNPNKKNTRKLGVHTSLAPELLTGLVRLGGVLLGLGTPFDLTPVQGALS